MPRRALSDTDIRTALKQTLEQFMLHDHYLLEFDVSERAVSHRLALHLQAAFPKLSVDCEYNRDLAYTKALDRPVEPIAWDDTEAKTVFPDIVVHRRGTNNDNLLVVEMKKVTHGVDADFDRDKLTAFVEQYQYRQGAFVSFTSGASGRFNETEWFPKPDVTGSQGAANTARRTSLDALPDLCTVEEARKYLRVSKGLAYELVASGQLESVRIGRLVRIPRDALARIARQRTEPG